MTIRIFAIASLLACMLASSPARADLIKPRADLTAIQTMAGEITMLHTMTPMNNAHDVQMLGFFKRSSDGPATQIPFEAKIGYQPLLESRAGADCVISGARVLRDGKRLHVVYAERKGNWFDKKPVTFQLFELTANDEEAPGTPPLYFALKSTVATKKMYCDVNDALDNEAVLYKQGIK